MALILSLALVAGAHARSAVPLIEPARVELLAAGANGNAEAVKNAIVAGGAPLGWAVVSSEPGKLRLKYNKQGKHEVVVDASYDATGYQLKYVSSFNMKYEIAAGTPAGNDSTSLYMASAREIGAGTPMIHPFYNKWVENLMRSIASVPINATTR